MCAQVCGVAVFGKVGVELHGVLGDHVKFGGEGVEVADYALEFGEEGGVLGEEAGVLGGVVGVGGAEGFDLCGGLGLEDTDCFLRYDCNCSWCDVDLHARGYHE